MKLSEATIKEIEATIKDQMENGSYQYDFYRDTNEDSEYFEDFEEEFKQDNYSIFVSYSVTVWQNRETWVDYEFGCMEECEAHGIHTDVNEVCVYDEETNEEVEVENWKDIRNF